MSLYVLMKCNLITYYFLRPNESTERPFLSSTHLFIVVLLVEVYTSLTYMPNTGLQISRIKWTFELFCAFNSLKFSSFISKFELFLFGVRFLGHFCTYLVTDQDYQDFDYFVIFTTRLLIVCTSCKTSYNILSRSHVKNLKGHYFENDAKCTAFLVKMSFICMKMKNHFHQSKAEHLTSFWYRGPWELGQFVGGGVRWHPRW